MARYPSGITPLPGRDVTDPRARARQLVLEDDAHPVSSTAPCVNPECAGPVDFVGKGTMPLYCSNTCRSRASKLRAVATEQLEVIERTLDETKHLAGIPRDELRSRARMLQWWLARLGPADER
ncbi:hypothetical protein [Janibacter anophelis]|uniref:hypothetical protein n=1 Tax=Janibacter anophelis TaxID=319054 RepID=UPI0013B05C41|nr:hypothetical protein [Janibacter anophelis]